MEASTDAAGGGSRHPAVDPRHLARDMALSNRLRTEGTANLVVAAKGTGPSPRGSPGPPVSAYLRDNPHYTFSDGSMTEARVFLEQLPVSPADRQRIARGNTEQLLRL